MNCGRCGMRLGSDLAKPCPACRERGAFTSLPSEEWCGALTPMVGGWRTRCNQRRGHGGPHVAVHPDPGDIVRAYTWSQEQAALEDAPCGARPSSDPSGYVLCTRRRGHLGEHRDGRSAGAPVGWFSDRAEPGAGVFLERWEEAAPPEVAAAALAASRTPPCYSPLDGSWGPTLAWTQEQRARIGFCDGRWTMVGNQ